MRKSSWTPALLIASFMLLIGCGARQAPQQSFDQPSQAGSPTAAAPATQPSPNGSPVIAQPSPFAPRGSAPGGQASSADRSAGSTIPAGTPIRVRLAQAIDTSRNRAGDRFTATLDEPIEVDGRKVVPKGASFTGHVTTSAPSGRLKGRAVLGLTLDSMEWNGKSYRVESTSASRVSASHKKRNLVMIGGGSGLGAALGAIAGGGKGALIGAGAGAAAGTAGATITGKRNVSLPAETQLHFTLRAPVTL